MNMLSGVTLAAILMFMALPSCTTLTPHQNFVLLIDDSVGKKIDDPRTNWVDRRSLVQSKRLPNGNIENKYRWRGTCRYYYEFDPKTRIIVSWRYEGSKEDCEIVPV